MPGRSKKIGITAKDVRAVAQAANQAVATRDTQRSIWLSLYGIETSVYNELSEEAKEQVNALIVFIQQIDSHEFFQNMDVVAQQLDISAIDIQKLLDKKDGNNQETIETIFLENLRQLSRTFTYTSRDILSPVASTIEKLESNEALKNLTELAINRLGLAVQSMIVQFILQNSTLDERRGFIPPDLFEQTVGAFFDHIPENYPVLSEIKKNLISSGSKSFLRQLRITFNMTAQAAGKKTGTKKVRPGENVVV